MFFSIWEYEAGKSQKSSDSAQDLINVIYVISKESKP